MLTRLSENKMGQAATPTDGRPWSYEAVEALLQLLVKMRPDVTIMTPQEDGSYWCDLASLFDPVRRGRSAWVNVSPSESHTGMLRTAYWMRNIADNDAVLGIDLMDFYSIDDPIITTKIKVSPQTLVEVKYADWATPMKFDKDQIAEAVRLFSREQPDEAWPSGMSSPNSWWSSAASGTISSRPYDPFVVMPKPAREPEGTSTGIGAKTIKDGMIPPSVYKGPPVEPTPKKKWWKRK